MMKMETDKVIEDSKTQVYNKMSWNEIKIVNFTKCLESKKKERKKITMANNLEDIEKWRVMHYFVC